ncbi:MAG: T9SS type A sorting domain-containing protein, partial [Cyclobacteriaceae bacterium]
GNSSVEMSYELDDLQPLSTASYYCLKQTDFDGTYSLSPVRRLTAQARSMENYLIYPNPAGDRLLLQAESVNISELKIYNSAGVNFTDNLTFEQKAGQVQVNVEILKPGIYLLVINHSKTIRFIKK